MKSGFIRPGGFREKMFENIDVQRTAEAFLSYTLTSEPSAQVS